MDDELLFWAMFIDPWEQEIDSQEQTDIVLSIEVLGDL